MLKIKFEKKMFKINFNSALKEDILKLIKLFPSKRHLIKSKLGNLLKYPSTVIYLHYIGLMYSNEIDSIVSQKFSALITPALFRSPI